MTLPLHLKAMMNEKTYFHAAMMTHPSSAEFENREKMNSSPLGPDLLTPDQVKEWHKEVPIELRHHLVFKM